MAIVSHSRLCGVQENAGGVSRDEMAAVLMEVVDGRLPKDRIALRELYTEISGWPWLDAEEDQTEGTGEAVANYEGITPTGTLVFVPYGHALCYSWSFCNKAQPCLAGCWS